MDRSDTVAGMTVSGDARGGGQHRGSMAVLVVVKIQGVTFAARMAMPIIWIPWEDVGRIRFVDRVLQDDRVTGNVAVGALFLMDSRWTVGSMAACHTGRVVENDV